MSIYIPSRDTTALEAVAAVESLDHRRLAEDVVSDALNRLIARHKGGLWEEGGPIPFAGWYWRDVDFFRPRGVTIADVGYDGTRVCQNNKWDYEERWLTDEEQATFRDLVWAAWQESRKGGSLDAIEKATEAALVKAGEFIESLVVAS